MSGATVFVKNEVSSSEMADIWDDSALIRMYEESISSTHEKLTNTPTSKKSTASKAVDGRKAEVLFDVYGNTETVNVDDLLRDDEEMVYNDATEQAPSTSTPRKEEKKKNTKKAPFKAPMPRIAPPPPPTFSVTRKPGEDEALSSMLMSWYMSGYHTGYYQALQDQKRNK